MFDWFMEYTRNFDFTSWMGFGLYWLPLSLCAYGFTLRTWANYQKDVAAREEYTAALDTMENVRVRIYYPTDTIGSLIGRTLVTVLPIANLWAATFDVAPRLFGSFFRWIGQVFNTPLVPKRK